MHLKFIHLFAAVQVFSLLISLMQTVSVASIVADFEVAAWKAIREVLPDVRVRGCYFHYAQAVWRNIQSQGSHTTSCLLIYNEV